MSLFVIKDNIGLTKKISKKKRFHMHQNRMCIVQRSYVYKGDFYQNTFQNCYELTKPRAWIIYVNKSCSQIGSQSTNQTTKC